MRRCFVHVGTHKTGTTSVQAFLAMNDGALRAVGVLVPLTGRPSHLPGYPNFGHHNVAWELNEDPRFRPESGTLNVLLSEIAQGALQAVVLSSEDFEYLHARPAALHELARALRGIGYGAEFITYLRPQSDYAQSLYLTLLPFGLDLCFPEFLEIVLQDGSFTFRDRWVFQFEYARLLDALADVAGPHGVSVRRYREGVESSRLLAEFASTVQPPNGAAAFERFSLPERMSTRMSLEAACELTDLSPALRRSLRDAAAAGSLLDAADRARLLARFRANNQELARRYGLQLPVLGSGSKGERLPQDVSFIQ